MTEFELENTYFKSRRKFFAIQCLFICEKLPLSFLPSDDKSNSQISMHFLRRFCPTNYCSIQLECQVLCAFSCCQIVPDIVNFQTKLFYFADQPIGATAIANRSRTICKNGSGRMSHCEREMSSVKGDNVICLNLNNRGWFGTVLSNPFHRETIAFRAVQLCFCTVRSNKRIRTTEHLFIVLQ